MINKKLFLLSNLNKGYSSRLKSFLFIKNFCSKESKNYPFKGFYLNSKEAYTLNEHDRDLLLLKSNSIGEENLLKFHIKLLDEMSSIKKLFPYLKGIDVTTSYLKENMSKFSQEQTIGIINNLEKLKIFDSELLEILSTRVPNFKSTEILNSLDFFSMGKYTKNEFWKKVSSVEIDELHKLNEIKELVQLNYNLSLSAPSLITLKRINKLVSYFESEDVDKDRMVGEFPRVMELINTIVRKFKELDKPVDEVMLYIRESIENNVLLRFEKKIRNNTINISNNHNWDQIAIIVLFKYLEHAYLSNGNLKDQLVFVLGSIDYSRLNPMMKIYFNFCICLLKNKLNNQSELLILVDKYIKDLNINIFNLNDHKQIDYILNSYYKSVSTLNTREKIFYDIEFFGNNSKDFSLTKINVHNSILTFS